jgi:transcriptional regulator
MYIPTQFQAESLPEIHAAMRSVRLANLVTIGPAGLVATPLPMLLDTAEGENGTLYAHVAKANPQWRSGGGQEALVTFMGPDAYITPSWYVSKQRDGRVVPTWNYIAVHAYGPVEFFEDADRLLAVVTRLTERHEAPRTEPWSVSDAPEAFVASQLRGIVGVRIPITRLEGKRKVSQNRTAEDRRGVKAGLGGSTSATDLAVADLVPD